MPSIGLHLAITLFILAACFKADELKPALLLLPFGLISDLDSFIGVHRATLHNLLVIAIPLLVMVAIKWYRIRAPEARYFGFASLLLASHIFLDAFYNGVFLLYPFSTESYNPQFWLGLKETGLSMIFTWIVPGKVGELEYVVTPQPGVPELPIIGSGVELVILLFAVLAFCLNFKGARLKLFIRKRGDKKVAR
jgi:hypothetical protein